jgi:hypothetical protein
LEPSGAKLSILLTALLKSKMKLISSSFKFRSKYWKVKLGNWRLHPKFFEAVRQIWGLKAAAYGLGEGGRWTGEAP